MSRQIQYNNINAERLWQLWKTGLTDKQVFLDMFPCKLTCSPSRLFSRVRQNFDGILCNARYFSLLYARTIAKKKKLDYLSHKENLFSSWFYVQEQSIKLIMETCQGTIALRTGLTIPYTRQSNLSCICLIVYNILPNVLNNESISLSFKCAKC